MTGSDRYPNLDFIPPAAVAKAAGRGLELRQEHGRGGTAIGVARARDLAAHKALSPATIRRMVSYFARHEVDKQGKSWASRSEPSAGYIAWLLWGGNAGKRWAEALGRKMDRADSKAKSDGGSTRKVAKTAKKAGKRAAKAVKKASAKKAAKKSSKQAKKKAPAARKASKRAAKKTSKKAAKRSAKKVAKKAPWVRLAPAKKSASKSMTPAQKRQARARAKRAGRSYPNLVDNMAVARKER